MSNQPYILPLDTEIDFTAGIVISAIVNVLAMDADLQAMADTNDLEHFTEGCKNNPAYQQKLVAAILKVRDVIMADDFLKVAA